jgi:hypothetical protein
MLQAIIFYAGGTCDLIKDDEAMKSNADDSIEKGKVPIKIHLMQEKKRFLGIKPEASEINKKE